MPDDKSNDQAKSLANLEISDLAGLSKPLTKLIKTVGEAIGVAYEPTRIRRKARAEADAQIALARSDIKITALQQRAQRRLLNTEARRQENIEAIVKQSAEDLQQKDEASVSDVPVDQDWVNDFFEICKDVGNPDMQLVWGRILSGEISKPGQYSRATLLILRSLSAEHASLFQALCRLVWQIPQIDVKAVPLILDTGKGIHTDLGLTYHVFQRLDDVGLISFSQVGGTRITSATHVVAVYAGQWHVFLPNDGQARDFPLGHVILTESGFELFPIAAAPPHPGHRQEVIEHLATQGWTLQPLTEPHAS